MIYTIQLHMDRYREIKKEILKYTYEIHEQFILHNMETIFSHKTLKNGKKRDETLGIIKIKIQMVRQNNEHYYFIYSHVYLLT